MKHSLTNRYVIGKSIGLVAGLLAVLILPHMGIAMGTEFSIGLVLFYVLMGAMVASVGVMTHHPVFKFRMPFWLRGALVGVFMHLVLILIAYPQMIEVVLAMDFMGMTSPYWALIDGVILGVLIDWAATKWAGEGNLPLQ